MCLWLPDHLLKRQILLYWPGQAQESAFLMSSQIMLLLLVLGQTWRSESLNPIGISAEPGKFLYRKWRSWMVLWSCHTHNAVWLSIWWWRVWRGTKGESILKEWVQGGMLRSHILFGEKKKEEKLRGRNWDCQSKKTHCLCPTMISLGKQLGNTVTCSSTARKCDGNLEQSTLLSWLPPTGKGSVHLYRKLLQGLGTLKPFFTPFMT